LVPPPPESLPPEPPYLSIGHNGESPPPPPPHTKKPPHPNGGSGYIARLRALVLEFCFCDGNLFAFLFLPHIDMAAAHLRTSASPFPFSRRPPAVSKCFSPEPSRAPRVVLLLCNSSVFPSSVLAEAVLARALELFASPLRLVGSLLPAPHHSCLAGFLFCFTVPPFPRLSSSPGSNTAPVPSLTSA